MTSHVHTYVYAYVPTYICTKAKTQPDAATGIDDGLTSMASDGALLTFFFSLRTVKMLQSSEMSAANVRSVSSTMACTGVKEDHVHTVYAQGINAHTM